MPPELLRPTPRRRPGGVVGQLLGTRRQPSGRATAKGEHRVCLRSVTGGRCCDVWIGAGQCGSPQRLGPARILQAASTRRLLRRRHLRPRIPAAYSVHDPGRLRGERRRLASRGDIFQSCRCRAMRMSSSRILAVTTLRAISLHSAAQSPCPSVLQDLASSAALFVVLSKSHW